MGQDTYAHIGVTVTLELTFSNIELLHKLIDAKIDYYLHPSFVKCDDEIATIDDIVDRLDDHFTKEQFGEQIAQWEFMFESKTEEEFNEYLSHFGLQNNYIHFIIEFTSACARNISRRTHPCLFGTDGVSIDKILDEIKNAKQKFILLGVSETMIEIGWIFADSY